MKSKVMKSKVENEVNWKYNVYCKEEEINVNYSQKINNPKSMPLK